MAPAFVAPGIGVRMAALRRSATNRRPAPRRAAARCVAEPRQPEVPAPADAKAEADFVGEAIETSLSDSLLKDWEALEHFGREGTVMAVQEEEDDDDDGEDEEENEANYEYVDEEVADEEVGEGAAGDAREVGVGAVAREAGVEVEAVVAPGRLPAPPPGLFGDEDEGAGVGGESAAAVRTESAEGYSPDVALDVSGGGAVGAGKKRTVRVRRKKAVEIEDEVERTMAEIHAAEVWDEDPNWFFLQVKPGCEKSCSISIRNMAISLKHVDIQEVLVPTIQTMRLTKSGKSMKREERLFPGYILVNMVLDRQTYNDVRQVTNIQWFMNDPNREKPKDAPFRPPIPVSDEEMRTVFAKIQQAESAEPGVKTVFRPGDLVRVSSGIYADSEGTVLEVKPDVDVITTTLVVFGRETAVDLQFSQVEMITSAAVLNPPKKRGRKSKAELEASAREEALADVPEPVMIPITRSDDGEVWEMSRNRGPASVVGEDDDDDDDHGGFEEAESL